jgi:arylsulfatase A-like enzyme
VVPLASEGLRKYSQDTRQPWRRSALLGDHRGRVLAGKRTALRLPWFDGEPPATLRLRAYGMAHHQRLALQLNGRRLAPLRLSRGWQVVDLPLAGTGTRAGENELVLFGGQGVPAGAERVFAALHSLELLPRGARVPREDWPALSPVRRVTLGGESREALTGFPGLVISLEIPRGGALELETGVGEAPRRFVVTARTLRGGEPRTLLDVRRSRAGWRPHRVDLTPLAGELVQLELVLPGGATGAAWSRPRITLPEAASRPRRRFDNAILFISDATRADQLTAAKAPRLMRAAAEDGVIFLNNQATAPSSPPAYPSVLTGTVPTVHGVYNERGRLRRSARIVSAIVRRAGLNAAYFGTNPNGMNRLQATGGWHTFMQRGSTDCKVLIRRVLRHAEVQAARRRRFFVTAVAYENHAPYRFHPGITERYFPGPLDPVVGERATGHLLTRIQRGQVQMSDARWRQLRALYDGETTYLDRCLGELLDGLQRRRLLQRTALLFTADHGEGFWERGRVGHAYGLHAELINVPLVLLAPGLLERSARLETVTSHLDVVPTLLDLLGLQPDHGNQGISLLPVALRGGSWTPRVVPSEYGRAFALRARQWKYLVEYSGGEQLFDVKTDPLEQIDLARQRPRVLRHFRDLAGFYLAHRRRWRASVWGDLNNRRPDYLERVGAVRQIGGDGSDRIRVGARSDR